MKNLKPISFMLAAIWTVIMIFVTIHNSSNKRFTVTHFQETELQKEAYKVDVSPALAWDYSAGFSRTTGWILLVIMWAAFFAVVKDLHLKFASGERSKLGEWLIFAPLILSVVFFLAGSSSIQSNNFVNVSAPIFKQWEAERKIEQKGEKTWIDADDDKVLFHAFDGKKVIR